MNVGFLDIETIGLDPRIHQAWEAALILRLDLDVDDDVPLDEVDDEPLEVRYEWQLPVDLSKADPMALTVSRFYERRKRSTLTPLEDFASGFAELTHGVRLVVNNPSFDMDFLSRLLRDNGACPGWHYQVENVRSLAIGYLRGLPGDGFGLDYLSMRSDELFERIGVWIDPVKRHTAIGDTELVMAVYDKVMGKAGE